MCRRPLATGHAASALLLLALHSEPAGALPHLQAVGESSLGYTDNAQADASSGGAGQAHIKSAFWMLSPGVVLALLSPRSLQRIGYRYEYDFYFGRSASSSSSNRLDYRGFFDLSRRVSLVLGGNATQSDRFNSVAFAAPAGGVVGAVPAGTGTFLQAAADQAFGFDVAEAYRAWQSANVVVQAPLFDTVSPTTVSAGLRTGIEHTFLADAAGVEARSDYSVVTHTVRPDGSAAETQRQVSAGGVALWRHDWSRSITSSADAGALRVERLNTQRGFWTPLGDATLTYTTENGDAQLGYAHALTTNALLGQSLLVDELRLRGSLPLTREGKLVLATTCGYQKGRLLDEDAKLATRVSVILADISLGWQATKWLALGIRFEHIQQKSGAEAPPLPVSFVQNNILAGASLRFPPERDMPHAYRAPRRVDRTDELRDGMRPTVNGPRSPGEVR